MNAVLVAPGATAGVQVGFAIAGAWPAIVAPGAAAATTVPAVPAAPPAPALSFGLALVFALIGGALLNLMPCVFPILSLKLLGFSGHAHSRRALLAGGIAYSAGVVLSFVALAALLLVLRAGGEQIGWGFQLQSPVFIAALAVLFTLIALNLAGLFEFGTLLPSGLASMRLRHPLADSALTGVLAVAVASPCTAPFMGAALGLAFTLPTAQALSLFGALGVGMALPYLAASAWPRVARAMPRPGVWMATFKTAMAFPMLATVVWLAWVLGQQTGNDGVVALLGVLVALAFALWAWGRIDSGRVARAAWSTTGVVLLGAVLTWALPSWREASAATSFASVDERWQPWSTERVAALNAEGRTVFVDFTAAWCVTCQVNKRTTLSDKAVLADFDAQARDPAARRLDAPRRRHQRRVVAPGSTWRAGVRDLQAGSDDAHAVARTAESATGARRTRGPVMFRRRALSLSGVHAMTLKALAPLLFGLSLVAGTAAAAPARVGQPAPAFSVSDVGRQGRFVVRLQGQVRWCSSGSTPSAPMCASITAAPTCRPRRRARRRPARSGCRSTPRTPATATT